jgi:hypothetical protein
MVTNYSVEELFSPWPDQLVEIRNTMQSKPLMPDRIRKNKTLPKGTFETIRNRKKE